jgi:hypothetical protein
MFLIKHNFVANERQMGWLFEKMDRYNNKEIDNADFKVALNPF